LFPKLERGFLQLSFYRTEGFQTDFCQPLEFSLSSSQHPQHGDGGFPAVEFLNHTTASFAESQFLLSYYMLAQRFPLKSKKCTGTLQEECLSYH
jgi:hypothetical protein